MRTTAMTMCAGAWLLAFAALAHAQDSQPGQALSAKQRPQWRSQIRETLFVPDPVPALDAQTHGSFEPAEGVIAHRVTYGTQFGLRVPAILYLPRSHSGPLPGLIVVNGHGGDKYSWYAFYCGVLYARAGAAVLTYDPIGEGERNAERKSGTRAHDKLLDPPELGRRLGGLMVTDVMQAVSFLRQRPEVDPRLIGAMGYSMGSFILSLAGAVDERLHAAVLVGGGNLDGEGEYWDKSKPMCQGLPYQALRFLGDRPAAIYALHASRGPTLIFNGLADTVVAIPTHGEAFFHDLRLRTARLCGKSDGVFDFELAEGVSHRPFFVTRGVAHWLERQLDFPNWTPEQIESLPTTHISQWAAEHHVAMDRGYVAEDREGGTLALGVGVPGLSRGDLSVFSAAEWERQKPRLIYETWVQKARESVGPLRTTAGSRYFVGPDGKPVYLTGSHMWNNLIDMVRDEQSEKLDYDAYLNFLERHGHNFIRLWAWDSVTWDTRANRGLGKDFVHQVAPLPWARTGPGNAVDGKPKFDLTRFDEAYFERLRSRVSAAGRRGIYVSVMFFEGWGLFHGNRGRAAPEGWAWRGHPFHPDNNINGINGDADGNPAKLEVHTLASPEINKLQAAYIRKVVDTVNDLDNVLYEVINEGGEKDWDWWVVKTLRDYERTRPKQHPIGITGHGAEGLEAMLASPADWISPGRRDGYGEDPPAWKGDKVSLLDTDHIWGVGGNPVWVWKAFVRGHNPIFMDPYDHSILGRGAPDDWNPIRQAMGHTRRLAQRLDLAAMTPNDDLASTRYCLAKSGAAYVVYLPDGGEAEVDLSAASGALAVEWIHPVEGKIHAAADATGDAKRSFRAPFAGHAVLYLKKQQ